MSSLDYRTRSNRKDPQARQKLRDDIDKTLVNCETQMKKWVYFSKKGDHLTFSSSSLIIPDGLRGPVVLDATASNNFLWELLGDRAHVIPTPLRSADTTMSRCTLREPMVSIGSQKGPANGGLIARRNKARLKVANSKQPVVLTGCLLPEHKGYATKRQQNAATRAKRAGERASDLGVSASAARIGRGDFENAKPLPRRFHLHFEVPAVSHLAQAKRKQSITADRTEGAHIRVPEAVEQANHGADRAT
jgi:hypothetical protein